jgi:hypothetical protein
MWGKSPPRSSPPAAVLRYPLSGRDPPPQRPRSRRKGRRRILRMDAVDLFVLIVYFFVEADGRISKLPLKSK